MRYAVAGIFGLCAMLLLWLYWPYLGSGIPSPDRLDSADVPGRMGAVQGLPAAGMQFSPAIAPYPGVGEGGHAFQGRLTSQNPEASLSGLRLALQSAAGDDAFRMVVRSDDAGRFHFQDLEAAGYVLLLEEESLAFSESTETLVHVPLAQEAEQVFEVVQGGGVRGQVFNEASGNPMGGVFVVALPYVSSRDAMIEAAPTPYLSQATDAEGGYHIASLTPGTYRLFAMEHLEADPPYHQALQYAQHRHALLQGLGLGMGVATPDETWQADTVVEVRVGETTSDVNLYLHVPQRSHIAGRVLDQHGNPIPEVSLRINQGSMDYTAPPLNQTIYSDEEGYFRFENLSVGEDYVVIAEHRIGDVDLPSESERVAALPAEGRDDLQFTLMRYAAIHGQVVDPNGKPYPLELGMVDLDQDQDRIVRQNQSDPEGNFSMRFLESGTYRIDALIGGVSFQELATLEVAPGEQIGPLTLVFDPSGVAMIDGIVQDATGSPIPHVQVLAVQQLNEPEGRAQVIADDSGRFRLVLEAVGRYRLVFRHGSYVNKALENIPANTQNLQVVLDSGNTLRGCVVDARSNRPIELFGVAVSSIGDASAAPSGMNPTEYRAQFADASQQYGNYSSVGYHEDGCFELQGLGGMAWISIRTHDYITHRQLIEGIGPGHARRELAIRLRPAPQCEGVVVDRMGRPIPSAQVRFDTQTSAVMTSTTTNEQGRFSIQRQQVGPDDALEATHSDYQPGAVSLPESDRDLRGLEIVLQRGAQLEGRITQDGRAAPDVQVAYYPEGYSFSPYSTRTASNGRYVLDNVMPGTGTLRLSWGDPGAREDEALEVELIAEHTITVDHDLAR